MRTLRQIVNEHEREKQLREKEELDKLIDQAPLFSQLIELSCTKVAQWGDTRCTFNVRAEYDYYTHARSFADGIDEDLKLEFRRFTSKMSRWPKYNRMKVVEAAVEICTQAEWASGCNFYPQAGDDADLEVTW